jgi:hypothetical protein
VVPACFTWALIGRRTVKVGLALGDRVRLANNVLTGTWRCTRGNRGTNCSGLQQAGVLRVGVLHRLGMLRRPLGYTIRSACCIEFPLFVTSRWFLRESYPHQSLPTQLWRRLWRRERELEVYVNISLTAWMLDMPVQHAGSQSDCPMVASAASLSPSMLST